MLDINKSGGIMGNKLKVVSTDDAADSVDALPALRKLLLSKPVAVIGPFSPTIEAVIHQFQANDVADFALGGTAQLDSMNFPYVFRTFASDSTEATAMAIRAINAGYKTASLIFDNSANSQGFVPPLEKAFTKLGGKVLSNQVDRPRPELLSIRAGQVIRQQASDRVRLVRHPDGVDAVVRRPAARLPQRSVAR